MDNLIKSTLLDYYYTNSDKTKRVGKISGVKMHKFMYFYNAFSFVDGKEYSDQFLKAYPQGPIYYDVFELYSRTKDTNSVIKILRDSYEGNQFVLDSDIAKTAMNLVDRFNDNELSEITHNFDIWKIKNESYKVNEDNNFGFNELTSRDLDFLNRMKFNFTDSYLQNFSSYYSSKNCYLLEKSNEDKILRILGGKDKLFEVDSDANPIYVYLDGEEVVID